MESFLTFVWEKSPIIAIIMLAIVATGAIVWWAAKFYHKVKHTDNEVQEVKTEVRDVAVKMEAKMDAIRAENKADLAVLREEQKASIMALKENDFFHTNKALLIGFSALLKDDPQRFERLKDAILESTPENRRDEIKAITI